MSTTQAINQIDDFPNVALIEDRPKQTMVFQLNLAVYLDAKVLPGKDFQDLKNILNDQTDVRLIIVRSMLKGEDLVKKVTNLLSESKLNLPVIGLGTAVESQEQGVVYLEEDSPVKPVLQTSAKILGITAMQMASKPKAEFHEVTYTHLSLLFKAPCEIFQIEGEDYKKIFSESDAISKRKIRSKEKRYFIKSKKRLRFANAVTQQMLETSEDLVSPGVAEEKKMNLLSASVDIVAAQFQSSGMDEEVVKLAEASIKAIEKIADTETSVGNLLKKLLDSEGGYLYSHCQLITFLGFHIIKMMGWLGEEQKIIISQAAFFHDISLTDEVQAKVRAADQFALSGITKKETMELVYNHAAMAAREMQNAPDINPEIIRVVLQHHGSKTGSGFSTSIGDFDNLTKTFIIAEEWADYLIALSEKNDPANNEQKMESLKGIYNDPQTHQIIETLRYLDPAEFARDFQIEQSAIISGEGQDSFEALVSGGSAALKTAETTIEGVTYHRTDEEIRVGQSLSKYDENGVQIIGKTEHISDDIYKVGNANPDEAGAGALKSDVTTIKGDGSNAAKPGNYVLRSLNNGGADQKKPTELKMKVLSGTTDLMVAAQAGELARVEELLKSESIAVEIKKIDAEGKNCVHYAAMGGSVPVLTALLAKGAQKSLADSKRRSPIYMAALHKQNDAFDYLLAQGCKANQQAMGNMTIAMVAAINGNLSILEKAFANGVKLDVKDHSGKTALDFAKMSKVQEVIDFIEKNTKK